MRYDPATIKLQIDQLLLLFPELAEDEILRADMIEGETDLHEFLRKVEQRRQDAVALANATDETIDALKQRRMRFERRDEAMRKLMFDMMQAAELKRVELPESTLSIRKGIPKVIIIDETVLPDEACRIKREPDKKAIKIALESGTVINGAVMSNAEDILMIRVK